MVKEAEDDAQRTPSAREQILLASELALAERETAVRERERITGEREQVLSEREVIARLQEEVLRARTETEFATKDRERLLVQMKAANEHLLLATLRADELTEVAEASRVIVRDSVAAATAAGRAKAEFLAMLGHELRNPLAPILTALDLMTMRDPTKFERERTIIERQVRHLVRLVDDLLDVSRITGGKIELQHEVVELAEVVALAVEIADPLLEAKAHHLTVEVGPRLMIDGDVTRLAQVVANLITNAAKYTAPHGTIVVLGERRGSSVWLAVRDNGIGITAEMLPYVFDLFAQEAQAIDRPAGGLGLGLAIVKSLVGMHGGTVTAHSEGLGRGSEFAIELPAATRPPDANAPHRPSTNRISRIVSRKVLVVDDNRDAAELIAMSLAQRGHVSRVAVDAPSALALVKDLLPDVVLLDIDLPVVDGYELAQLIRASVAPHEVQFIAITGYGQAADRDRSDAAGFALHLVKPVSIARLEQGIRDATGSLALLGG